MDYLNLMLIAIIIYIGYLLSNKRMFRDRKIVKIPSKKIENFKPSKKTKKTNDILVNSLLDDLQDWDKNYTERSKIKKNVIKPNFINTSFHNDYRDVITTFNNIVPSHKQLFNIANIPLKYSEPPKAEAKGLILGFIDNINAYIQNNVNATRDQHTGWDEPLKDPNVESGWDRVQKGLGLTPSVYNEPLGQTGVKLISIEKIQKYETEDEIKYACMLIMEKLGSEEQMLFKVSFVINKGLLHDENRFFSIQNVDLDVVVEEIYIEGYLSDKGEDANKLYKNIKGRYYELDRMEQNNLTDPLYIQKKLMEHHNKTERESEYRNALLDEEGRDFHKNLANPYDYSSYQVTQTIFDDMNPKKKN